MKSGFPDNILSKYKLLLLLLTLFSFSISVGHELEIVFFILYYEGYFDSLVQELALKLDVSEDDINMTVAYFTKCGLIQIDDDGHATLSQAKAMVESETNWAKYKRDQRKK